MRRNAEKLQPIVEEIRAAGGVAHGYGSDARKEDEVAALVEQIESAVGPIEVFAFNVGANVPCSILEETARKYSKVWEMACFGGFLTGRRWRSAWPRALAQSMARELWPMNVHVAHVVIDGAIDTAFIRDNFPAKYAEKDRDGILSPAHIAEAYWFLHNQPRDAWTFELDLRPWSERW